MASGPITSWQIDGETMETMRDFIFLGSKITAPGDLPNPEIEPASPAWQMDSLLLSHLGSPQAA